MDKSNWERLEGKQIIMIGVLGLKPVHIGEIVGCDPDIGICIANVGETDPWCIMHGPKSTILTRYPKERIERQILELESVHRQLQSGYFSRYEDDNNEKRIYGKILSSVPSNNNVCPFSM